ncbi:patronin isoform X12 [Drosophila mojavensis]|uniref:patronin isoform X12 n=1 Tax=Drosophila mojavensis TaxID=7230 RepID=UPI0013EEA8A3|nr:patronin isoform X12 [Drosophila mojavensis]
MDAETQEIRQARQRASVKWLLSKAFNNRVPDNLKEPFYRDHENQERLKPQIVVELGNATLYCQTLSNLYSDPNYQSLNHWSILQTLARKGVPVAESSDMPITETVLIQTNPLRINAHMSVIESLMVLYAKEISSGDRVVSAIRRISGSNYQAPQGQSYEQGLLAWISHACAALKKRIVKELESSVPDEIGTRLQTPDIPPVRDFQDLCDGICLALLISYYCPKVVPWTSVRINYLPAVEDSIHNILLVSNFSQKHLPYGVFHMTPEDITYMRGSMKLNLVLLLTDLFNLFEIHPAKCVCYPGMDGQDVIQRRSQGANEHGICHRRGLTVQPVTPIPDLRSDLDQPPIGSPSSRPPFQVPHTNSFSVGVGSLNRRSTPPTEYQTMQSNNFDGNQAEAFVVHKSRGITTLSSMHSQQQQQQQQQHYQLQQQQQPQSQQEPLVPARLRQAKEKNNVESKADERGDFVAAGRPSNWDQNRRPSFAGRRSRRNSSSEDSQLTIENFGGSQDQINTVGRYERERDRERKLSNTSVGKYSYQSISFALSQFDFFYQFSEPAVAVRSSIADARGTLQLGYDTDSGSEKQDRETEKYSMRRQASIDNVPTASAHNLSNAGSPLPARNKQHSIDRGDYSNAEHYNDARSSGYDPESTPVRKSSTSSMPASPATWQYETCDDDLRSLENATKLSTMRMKLEERRRRIEQDKRKIELAVLRHQEKVCQEDLESCPDVLKWETMSNDSKRTPEMDPADMDKYQQSIAIMNMNLQDIQQDIHRLATQQSQMQAQHLQAQQLMQAQQIANMLNQQQTYGSQQHLAEHHYQQRPMQQSFGSSPHLPQAFNAPVSAYNSRPPSRDPYQQQQQHHPHQQPMQMPPMQYVNEHGQYMSPPAHYMQPQSIYSDNGGAPYNNHSPYGAPPMQQYQQQQHPQRNSVYDEYGQPANHFYLHESPPQPLAHPQRRTWAHSAAAAAYEQQQQQQAQQQQPLLDVNAWQTQKKMQQQQQQQQQSWPNRPPSSAGASQGFVLHQNGGGGGGELQHLFQVQSSPQHSQRMHGGGSGSSNGVQRQQSLTNLRDNRSPKGNMGQNMGMGQPEDMMAPQSICFIGDEEDVDELERNIIESMQSTRISDFVVQQQQRLHHQQQQQQQQQQLPTAHSGRGSSSEDYDSGELISNKLNITSGNLTYRIPSPSRPSIQANSFQDPRGGGERNGSGEEQRPEKGFYISFDNDQPKRPKPPLRAKKSPKKESSRDSVDNQVVVKRESLSQLHNSNNIAIEEAKNNAAAARHSIHNFPGGQSNSPAGNATYNKYTDEPPIQLRQITTSGAEPDAQERRHLEDLTNQPQQQQQPLSPSRLRAEHSINSAEAAKNKALVIGADSTNLDPESVDEMERRKEKIMLLSLQRRQQQEEAKARKEIEASQKREKEREKEEERARKKEEQMARRAAILEQHRLKKAIEEAEREGKTLDRPDLHVKLQPQSSSSSTPRLRQQRVTRPRPKTIHVDDASVDISEASSLSSRGKKGSSSNLTGYGQLSSNSMKRDFYRGSQDSLTVKESPDDYPSTSSTPIGRRGSYKTSRGWCWVTKPAVERGRTLSRISVAKGSTLNFRGRKSNSLMNLCDTDSGLGRATPPRRAPSPGMAASGPKLYKQPAAKSNRGIILNAVEYCVFPGAVNREAKQKVLEKIARSEAKHFLVLFRDAGCQFRALYSYLPETDQVTKLYGTGPSQVDEVMFDKFFKYNSGGKCFSQVHTKHLTVTIDAFTIHNSLWQGKRVQLPSKKDMALVI